MPHNKHPRLRFAVIALALIALVTGLNLTFGTLSATEDLGQIIYGLLMILIIASALAFGNPGKKVRHLLIWFMIFVVGMIGYSYRGELSAAKERVLAELIPGRGVQGERHTARFPVSDDGHFYIRATVNGVPILFLADTGATGIVLSPKDAEKCGFRPSDLTFDRIFRTANGMGRGSSIRLGTMAVGEFRLESVAASVNEAPMRESLLGMTFFERLDRYDVTGDVLTLYWGKG
ncbi:retropepsin-like aspartic protease family protein [Desulfoluna spongiiphila]|uniref:retropepsin-like aspartic protease family protein n=1 Tax=Desulfoluna spongiiphila TaxID=419481 RepID=UPI001253B964|nr:TIGR02281 family clan AA aspartic protease [Desulfoluna spongiiphila]VVS91901.1 gag-polyprotein putative aspartyl protease [Desulfoluna spongiiphila]